MPWELLFIAVFAGLVVLLDRDIDTYPPEFSRSTNPKRESAIILSLWGVAIAFNALRQLVIEPYLATEINLPTVRELIYLPLVSLPFLVVPLYLSLKIDKYSIADLGLTQKSRSLGVVIFAVAFGMISGVTSYWTGETVVGISVQSIGAILLLLYNNAFIEEFFYRGVIQNRLEKTLNQRMAVLLGGVIFASTHLLLDYKVLSSEGGLLAILYAVIMQILGGWLLGIIFIKTRTLWPGVICHYLVNWLPSLLSLLMNG
jgi:CAAX protease family protein